ncbi:MAG: sigma-70 family RNA polymerase sigma factor [Bacteroidaceae bacterium]|nr:sigma-70 family RNA polymerase sigma factor [Bacteroidaceae bacterium]
MSIIIRTQNHAAIAQAFADYRPELLTYLTFRTGDAADAEDIVQDTFLQLLEYEQVILPTTFKRLLFRTARNLFIDRARRRQKRNEIYSYIYDTTPQGIASTEHAVAVREITTLEAQALQAMPQQRQRVYQMVQHENLSAKDVARMLNIDYRTVSTHLYLGRRDVRMMLRAAGF